MRIDIRDERICWATIGEKCAIATYLGSSHLLTKLTNPFITSIEREILTIFPSEMYGTRHAVSLNESCLGDEKRSPDMKKSHLSIVLWARNRVPCRLETDTLVANYRSGHNQ